jgi:hypothetical protein
MVLALALNSAKAAVYVLCGDITASAVIRPRLRRCVTRLEYLASRYPAILVEALARYDFVVTAQVVLL